MDIDNLGNLFMMIVVSGLGGAKLLEMWQAHRLKTAEKQLDHDIEKDNKAIDYIIQDAERNRQRVEDLENNKFLLMREDVNALLDRMTPCETLLTELHNNREISTKLIQQVLIAIQTHSEALKFVVERLRLDKSKPDTTGRYSMIMDALSDMPTHDKIKTGQFPLHPRPDNET